MPDRAQRPLIRVTVLGHLYMEVSENEGIPCFGVLILRILLFRVLY